MADFFGGIQGIGSGIAGLFNAGGLSASANDLDAAARLEDVNARISTASTDIQLAAVTRDALKTIGGQAQDVATAGFSASGTALDLLADSQRQASLASALTATQGAIETQSHVAQAGVYRSEAASARRQSTASTFGGLLSIGLGIFSLFSDKRMKENITRVGTSPEGLPIVKYNYLNDPTEWIGYLAQDVEKIDPKAVVDMGMKMIDSKYRPERVNA